MADEIKIDRFNVESAGGSNGDHWLDIELDPSGEWCYYEDVEKLIKSIKEKKRDERNKV